MTTELLFPVLIIGLLLCCGFCACTASPTAPRRRTAWSPSISSARWWSAFVAIIMVVTGKAYLLDVALVWALVSFVGTLALAKYLVGKRLDE